LDDLVGNSKLMKIRRQATTVRVAAVPLDPCFGQHRNNDIRGQGIQIDGFSYRARKHQSVGGIA
jgi:hypothetical protein